MRMNHKNYCELTVQAHMRFAGLVRELIHEVAAPARLTDDKYSELEKAVEEAYKNAVEHAYEPGSAGTVTVTAEFDPAQMLISVRDRGIPFDATLESTGRKYDADLSTRDISRRTGLQMIRSVMDQVQWVCLGTEGKELQMILHLHRDHPDTHFVIPETPIRESDQQLLSPHTYTVRLLQSDDALGVARCVFETYGYSYPSSDIYYPQRIVELNQSGALISVVAVSDQTGEVVGHCSLYRCYQGATAESSQGVVKSAHQGRSLLSRMLKCLIEKVISEGLRCLVAHEVTSNPASQIVSYRAGFKPCALALGAMPSTLNFRKMTGIVPQRESCTVSMKFLVHPEGAVVCAPTHHREMVAKIYDSIGKPVTFQSLPSPSGLGETAIQLNRSWNIADIQVRRTGKNSLADIRRCLRDLLEIGNVEVVYLELPLDQGGIDDICRDAEEQGFFFAGLNPSSVKEGESLYLQYLNTELDMSHLHIATQMGKEIFAYVDREQQRIQK